MWSTGACAGVQTEWGPVEAEVVVNAGGMYAAEIGRLAGVRVPIIPFAHEYLVTQPFRERERDADGEIVHLPTLRDPDLLIYFREEGAGLVMGGYERDSAPWSLDAQLVDRIPADFNGRLLEEDWPRFEEIAENSRERVPLMEDVKVTQLINGPEAFTPDNEFCLGESEVRGFFVAAGFCAHGLAGAGGMGKLMAEWIVEGEPGLDVWEMDIRRFGPQYRSPSYTLKRTKEVYETYYDIRYPGHERQAGRPLRLAAGLSVARRARRRVRREVGLGARQLVRAERADGDAELRPRGWAGMHWSPAIGAEALGTRERAGLFDESSFSKLEISGPGRGGVARAAVRQPRRARRRADHLHADAEPPRRDRVRLHRHARRRGALPDRHRHRVRSARRRLDPPPPARRRLGDAERRDLALVVLRAVGAAGARRAGAADARPAGLRLHAHARAHVGDVPVRALRVTYVGEFGWELYCPSEYGLGLWRALWESGRAVGLVAGGYRAIDSLRLEKGYRAWASDITPDDSPYEAGLGFCVAADKDFNGVRGAARSGRSRGGCAASLSPIRARSRSATSRCGSAVRWSAA